MEWSCRWWTFQTVSSLVSYSLSRYFYRPFFTRIVIVGQTIFNRTSRGQEGERGGLTSMRIGYRIRFFFSFLSLSYILKRVFDSKVKLARCVCVCVCVCHFYRALTSSLRYGFRNSEKRFDRSFDFLSFFLFSFFATSNHFDGHEKKGGCV